ncbi:hypothetical protein FPV67DRAFT_1721298 [Lyophyllum atratum]|nr:hypothetical protein FPV67DRAFT_1721298 [Lyophyllum atratum]
MPSILPQEIVDKIIEDIDGRAIIRKPALRSCSLVSRSFRDPAQKHLFRYLLIHLANVSHYAALCKILRASPRMCSLVESICFIFTGDTRPEVTSEGLPDLPRLHHVTLTTGRYSGFPDTWAYISEAVRNYLCDIIRRPTVAVLSIYLIYGVPTDVICSCSQLTMLDIWNVSFIAGSHGPPPSHPLPSSIEAEQLHILRVFSETGTTVVGPPPHASPAEESPPSSILRLNTSDFAHMLEEDEFAEQLDSRGCQLPYFEAIESNTKSVAKSLNLPNLRTLRRLSKNLKGGPTIHAVWDLLRLFPDINNLVELAITTDVEDLMGDPLYPAVLAHMDRHLTEHRPPGARRTTVMITLSKTDSYSTEAIRTFFNEMLPRLLESGQLKLGLYWPTRVPSFVAIMPLV